MASALVMERNELDFDAAVSQGVTLVDFWAPWCGPCRMMGPVLEELAAELEGKASVVKVNVDDNPSLAARFYVQSIPLLVVLKDGQEIGRTVGVQPKGAILKALRAAMDE